MIRFDLNLLSTLIVLYEERNVTRTARKLGLSQPSVSRALNKLRAAFEDQLFVKTNRGVEPTARATSLVVIARDILSRVERQMVSATGFDPAKTETTFTFALNESGEVFFLPILADALRKLAPRAHIRSVYPPFDEKKDGLMSGEIDLAFGAAPIERELSHEKLFDTEFACMVRADHPFRGSKLTLKQYLDLEHVTVTRPLSAESVQLQRREINRKTVLVATHYMSLPVIVQRTDLAATLIRPLAIYFLKSGAKVRILKMPAEFPLIPIHQVWHRRFDEDARSVWLRGLVKTLFPNKVRKWLR